jgi:alanine racemase
LDRAPKDETRRAWVEVDLGALRRNFARLAERAGGPSHLIAMVKADAYGLGAPVVAGTLRETGPWAFGVATVEEGAELRAAGIDERIIVFAPCPPLDSGALWAERLEPSVSSIDGLRWYASGGPAGGVLPVHLEIDTGMGRQGLLAGEADRWIGELGGLLEQLPVRLASTFTHFHSAEFDPEATSEQMRRYLSVLEEMRGSGIDPGRTHAANSAALLEHGLMGVELARPGIFLYGGGHGHPEPVVAVRARVLDVRTLPAGHGVSYGATWKASAPTTLATLGIGYGDGLRTSLSNRGAVLVHGAKAPIRGAVCMDVTIVEIGEDARGEVGDRVTVLGTEGEETITLAELANAMDATEYEVLTGLRGRLSRVYLESRS